MSSPLTADEEAELARLEKTCAYCRKEVGNKETMVRFACLHICHFKCAGRVTEEKCPDCIAPTKMEGDTGGIPVNWMNDKELKKKVEQRFGKNDGEDVEEHYADQDYYDEVQETMDSIRFLKLSKEEREAAIQKEEEEEIEYSYEYEEESKAKQIARKIAGIAAFLHKKITINDESTLDTGMVEALEINFSQRKALFQDLTLNPMTVKSDSITLDFVQLNSEFMTFDRFMDAKIGLLQLYWTVGVQEWSDLLAMGFQTRHMLMENDETDPDILIVMYGLNFAMLQRDLGLKLSDITSWPLGRLVRLGLNMNNMINDYKLTAEVFAEFHPKRITEWKKRLRITVIHLMKLPMNPELLKRMGWNINVFLDAFQFTQKELDQMEFTEKEISILKQLSWIAENLKREEKKTTSREKLKVKQGEELENPFSIF